MGGALIKTIEQACSMGAEFRIAGDGKVMVRGLTLLPPEIQNALRQHRTQVLQYLESECQVPPVIWETGNLSQIRSLLVLREAELILAKAQLTGDDYRDWYVHNQIRDLETKIADLKRWLNEAMAKDSNHGD